jgi:hypothetical protein
MLATAGSSSAPDQHTPLPLALHKLSLWHMPDLAALVEQTEDEVRSSKSMSPCTTM